VEVYYTCIPDSVCQHTGALRRLRSFVLYKYSYLLTYTSSHRQKTTLDYCS